MDSDSSAEETIKRILGQIVDCVGRLDYDGVRNLIPDDGLYFGSVAPIARGYDELKERQFLKVWPNIKDFTILPNSMSVKTYGPHAWATCVFESGLAGSDDQTVRRGRMTFIFEQRDGEWVMVHSHDSLFPVGPQKEPDH